MAGSYLNMCHSLLLECLHKQQYKWTLFFSSDYTRHLDKYVEPYARASKGWRSQQCGATQTWFDRVTWSRSTCMKRGQNMVRRHSCCTTRICVHAACTPCEHCMSTPGRRWLGQQSKPGVDQIISVMCRPRSVVVVSLAYPGGRYATIRPCRTSSLSRTFFFS